MGKRARRRLREHWDLRHPEPRAAYDNLDDDDVDPDLLDDVDHESVGRSCMWAVALWKALRARPRRRSCPRRPTARTLGDRSRRHAAIRAAQAADSPTTSRPLPAPPSGGARGIRPGASRSLSSDRQKEPPNWPVYPSTHLPRYAPLIEAADYAGVPVSTLRHYVRTGQLPAYRFGKRLLQIDLNDIDRMRQKGAHGHAQGQEQRMSGRRAMPGRPTHTDATNVTHKLTVALALVARMAILLARERRTRPPAEVALYGTPIERHVLLVIGETSDYQTGWCLDTLDGLARDTGYGRSTIGRAVAALVVAGALERPGLPGPQPERVPGDRTRPRAAPNRLTGRDGSTAPNRPGPRSRNRPTTVPRPATL